MLKGLKHAHRSGSQYYTPLSTGGSQASLPASPVWVSPVPLERWNLITERLKVLRLELKVRWSEHNVVLKGMHTPCPLARFFTNF